MQFSVASTDASWAAEVEATLPEAPLLRIALWTVLVVLVGLGGLTGWAAITRIESAVPATGTVVSGGKRKTISLLDSGILRSLAVGEGEKVVAGQQLLQIDDTQARTARSQAFVLYWSTVAKAERLAAEANDKRELPISPRLKAAATADLDISAAVDAEAYQFRIRWGALDASVHVQERKIAQNQAQISALGAQIAANGTRLALVQEELHGVDSLMQRGLATKPRQLDLKRTEAELRGQIGALAAQITQTQQAIAQVDLEIVGGAESRRSDISRERAETQAAQADAEQRLAAAEDLLQKREVRAPEAGTVTDIKFFTPGSSIVAGQPVMDLVPETSTLLIEASVAPNEVEHLAVGQKVNVRLTSYKAHRVPVLQGHLTYVGADRQLDPNGQPFFLVRATLEPDALRGKAGVVLLPGMPAEVLIVNGARSALDFFISPITDSIHHAMSEE